MNSSGMKRGLAVSAVAAMAMTGIPALMTSASGATTDVLTVGSTGPALNGGSIGSEIVLNTKGVDPAQLKLIGSDLSSPATNANQTVTLLNEVMYPSGSPGDTTPTDGLDQIVLHVGVTTPTVGSTASFQVYEDEAPQNNKVDASEPRASLSVTTTGQVAQIDVSPASQQSSAGVPSGPYTVTLKDSAGRKTQLNGGEEIAIHHPAGASVSESGDTITAAEIPAGTRTFTATGDHVDVYNIELSTVGVSPLVKGFATLDVVKTAYITAPEVDVVTAPTVPADSWNGFGGGSFGGTTDVRVDQTSVRIDIKSVDPWHDAGGTVVLNVEGHGMTFGGKSTTTVSTVLDGNGVGSLVITPDAGTIQEGDSFSVSGAFSETFRFERAAVSAIKPGAATYVSKVDGSVTVTATVVDQFGNGWSTGEVSAERTGGPNPSGFQRKPIGPGGQVSFTFTDMNAVPYQTDTVKFLYYTDQYDPSGDHAATTTILTPRTGSAATSARASTASRRRAPATTRPRTP